MSESISCNMGGGGDQWLPQTEGPSTLCHKLLSMTVDSFIFRQLTETRIIGLVLQASSYLLDTSHLVDSLINDQGSKCLSKKKSGASCRSCFSETETTSGIDLAIISLAREV